MIWGLTLQPGKVHTETVRDELQLSMAILESRKGISANESNFSHIVMKTYNTEYLLCTLVNGSSYQQTLDLKIMPREKVTFSVQGTNTVYLVGYSSLCPDVSHDYEMGVDQDVSYSCWEEDCPRDVVVVKEEPSSPHAELGDHLAPGGSLQSRDDPTTSGTEQHQHDGTSFDSYPTNVAVVKEEPSSPHADLRDRLAPSGSLQSHNDPTTSDTEQHQHDGTSFESYQTNVAVVKEEPSSPQHADLSDHLAPGGSLQSHDDPTTSGTEQHQHDGTSFESYPTNVVDVRSKEKQSGEVKGTEVSSKKSFQEIFGSLVSSDEDEGDNSDVCDTAETDMNPAKLKDQSGTMKESKTTSQKSFSSSDEESDGDSSIGFKAKSDNHPSASSWSLQSSVGPPSQSDPLFNPGQPTANLGQITSSKGSSVYPVGVVGPSHPPAALQNFQQSPNKRRRIETVPTFPPTQQTLNNSCGSQFPVHTRRVETGLSQGPSTLGWRKILTPSMGAAEARSATVKQSLNSLIPRNGSATKTVESVVQRSVSAHKHSSKNKKKKNKKKNGKKRIKTLPFCCNICDKSFKTLPSLTDHERVHSGIKPFTVTPAPSP